MTAGRRAVRATFVRALAGLAIAAASLQRPEAVFLGPIATALLDIALLSPRRRRRSLG